jgi:hypothetical protein
VVHVVLFQGFILVLVRSEQTGEAEP